jgi:hypothetical protein
MPGRSDNDGLRGPRAATKIGVRSLVQEALSGNSRCSPHISALPAVEPMIEECSGSAVCQTSQCRDYSRWLPFGREPVIHRRKFALLEGSAPAFLHKENCCLWGRHDSSRARALNRRRCPPDRKALLLNFEAAGRLILNPVPRPGKLRTFTQTANDRTKVKMFAGQLVAG